MQIDVTMVMKTICRQNMDMPAMKTSPGAPLAKMESYEDEEYVSISRYVTPHWVYTATCLRI